MALGTHIAQLRKDRGLTQQQLAAKVYVTRQAVSRWETGESEPGIDMRKLLALALDVPVMTLIETPDEAACQCCGAPFSVPNMEFGTNADGTENTDYCKWCYDNGQFAYANIDDLAEYNAPYLAQATGMSLDEAASYMMVLLPSLKRWSTLENGNVAGNAKRSKFYVCPQCGNIAWSMGELGCSCCGVPLEPLAAAKPNEAHVATVEIMDGCHVVALNHPMEKDHYVSFIACVSDDLVRIKRLYPQQEALARFELQGPCKIYAFCSEHGLFQVK